MGGIEGGSEGERDRRIQSVLRCVVMYCLTGGGHNFM